MSTRTRRSSVLAPLRQPLSRRTLVNKAGALALGGTLVGSLPGHVYSARKQSLSGKIRMEAHDYTPSQSMEKTPNNPIPHDALARVIEQYQEMHPEVEIELLRVPEGDDARVWAVTQLTGDIAPDIMWTQSFDANRDIGKGWWVELDPYLEEPNPYVEAGQPGSERWLDQFFEGPTAAKFAPDGHIYVIPYDLVTTFFYYNEQIFEQAGVSVPETYAEMIEFLAAIEESGVVAYNGMIWSQSQLGEMVLRPWKENIEPTGDAGAYTQKDITLAIIDGTFDATKPEYKDWLRLTKESVPYWSEQWTVADTVDFPQHFSQGRLGILEDGSWQFGLLEANDELEFTWGSFFMPTLTNGTGTGQSEFANGEPAPAIGGATSNQYGVTKTAVQNDTVDLCIDFLRYICAPPQASEIIAELGQFLPNIKGVDVNENLRGALEAVSSGVGEAGIIAYPDKIVSTEAVEQIETLRQNFFLDRAELDETAVQIQEVLLRQAEAAVEEFGW